MTKQIQTVVIGNEPDNKNGLFKSHKPDIKAKEIFESIKQTKVRLPEEIRNYIADKVMPQNDDANAQLVGLIENYLAQAQQEAVEREHQNFRIAIKQIIGTNAVFLLPSHTEMVEGFWNNKEYRVKGIDVTKEIVKALQGGQDD